jgi:hypothetical protein
VTTVHGQIWYFEVHDGTGAIGIAWVARTNIRQKLDVARPPDARVRLDGYICVLVEAERHGPCPV